MKRGFIIVVLLFIAVLVNTETGRTEYGDIVIATKLESMKKADVKPVMFPHWFHRIRFKCKACHEDIFILRRGANDINMKKIMEGEFCGKCHNGLIAWEPLYCDRCHSWEGEIPPYPADLQKPATATQSAPSGK